MGLDGISINQLRTIQEVNKPIETEAQNIKKIDSATKGKKVKREKDKEKEEQQQNWDNDDNEDEVQSDDLQVPTEAVKYDLSDSEKYQLKIDEQTNNVIIYKKDTNEVIQVFSADVLLNLTSFLQDSQGVLVNRKY